MSTSSLSSIPNAETSEMRSQLAVIPTASNEPTSIHELHQSAEIPAFLLKDLRPEPEGSSPALIGFTYTFKVHRYTFKETTASFRKGALASPIWADGYEAVIPSMPGNRIWICARCWNKRNRKGFVQQFVCYAIGKSGNATTKRVLNHLQKHENNDIHQGLPEPKRQRTIYDLVAGQVSNGFLLSQQEVELGSNKLVQWIIAAQMPLISVELDEF
ncbi:MAG: hypothetical protein M1829_001355 [Trizodia sp. TS-e1964]|nr:MAG: hypothetical protein M1829_001355 [Trizodia sp. TS-e1964]